MNLSGVKSRLAKLRIAKSSMTQSPLKEPGSFPADIDSVVSQNLPDQSAPRVHTPVAFVPLEEFAKTNGQSKQQVWRDIHRGKRMAKQKNGDIYVEVKFNEQMAIPEPTSPKTPDSPREGVIQGGSVEPQEMPVYKSSAAAQPETTFDTCYQDLKEHISELYGYHFTTQKNHLNIELNRQQEFLSDQVSSIRKDLSAAFFKTLTHELGEQKKALNSVVTKLQKDGSTELVRQISQELKQPQKDWLSRKDNDHQNLIRRLEVLQRGLAEQSDAMGEKLKDKLKDYEGMLVAHNNVLGEQIDTLSEKWKNTEIKRDQELHKQRQFMGGKLQAYEKQLAEALSRFADMLASAQTDHQRQKAALDEKITSVHDNLSALTPISDHIEQMRVALNKNILESTKHLKREITHEVQSELKKQKQSIRQYVAGAHQSLADILVEMEKKQVRYDLSGEVSKLHKAMIEDIQHQLSSEFKRQRAQMSGELSKAQGEMGAILEGHQNQLQAVQKTYEKLHSTIHSRIYHQAELSKMEDEISKLRHQLKEQNTLMLRKDQQLEDLEVLNKALLERDSPYMRHRPGPR